MVATKDSEFPMRAHLRGAVALINEKDNKRIDQTPSQQVSHAVEAQIVSTFSNKLSSSSFSSSCIANSLSARSKTLAHSRTLWFQHPLSGLSLMREDPHQKWYFHQSLRK